MLLSGQVTLAVVGDLDGDLVGADVVGDARNGSSFPDGVGVRLVAMLELELGVTEVHLSRLPLPWRDGHGRVGKCGCVGIVGRDGERVLVVVAERTVLHLLRGFEVIGTLGVVLVDEGERIRLVITGKVLLLDLEGTIAVVAHADLDLVDQHVVGDAGNLAGLGDRVGVGLARVVERVGDGPKVEIGLRSLARLDGDCCVLGHRCTLVVSRDREGVLIILPERAVLDFLHALERGLARSLIRVRKRRALGRGVTVRVGRNGVGDELTLGIGVGGLGLERAVAVVDDLHVSLVLGLVIGEAVVLSTLRHFLTNGVVERLAGILKAELERLVEGDGLVLRCGDCLTKLGAALVVQLEGERLARVPGTTIEVLLRLQYRGALSVVGVDERALLVVEVGRGRERAIVVVRHLDLDRLYGAVRDAVHGTGLGDDVGVLLAGIRRGVVDAAEVERSGVALGRLDHDLRLRGHRSALAFGLGHGERPAVARLEVATVEHLGCRELVVALRLVRVGEDEAVAVLVLLLERKGTVVVVGDLNRRDVGRGVLGDAGAGIHVTLRHGVGERLARMALIELHVAERECVVRIVLRVGRDAHALLLGQGRLSCIVTGGLDVEGEGVALEGVLAERLDAIDVGGVLGLVFVDERVGRHALDCLLGVLVRVRFLGLEIAALVGHDDGHLGDVLVVGVAGLCGVLLGDGIGEGLLVLATGVLAGTSHVRLRVGNRLERDRTLADNGLGVDYLALLVLEFERELLVGAIASGDLLRGVERDRAVCSVSVLEGPIALVGGLAHGHGAVAVVGDLDRGRHGVIVVCVAGLTEVLLGDGVGEGLLVLALGVLGGVGHVRLRVGYVGELHLAIGVVGGSANHLADCVLKLERECALREIASGEILVDLEASGGALQRVGVHERDASLVGRCSYLEGLVLVICDCNRHWHDLRIARVTGSILDLLANVVGERLALHVSIAVLERVLVELEPREAHVTVAVVLSALNDVTLASLSVVGVEQLEGELVLLEVATVEILVGAKVHTTRGLEGVREADVVCRLVDLNVQVLGSLIGYRHDALLLVRGVCHTCKLVLSRHLLGNGVGERAIALALRVRLHLGGIVEDRPVVGDGVEGDLSVCGVGLHLVLTLARKREGELIGLKGTAVERLVRHEVDLARRVERVDERGGIGLVVSRARRDRALAVVGDRHRDLSLVRGVVVGLVVALDLFDRVVELFGRGIRLAVGVLEILHRVGQLEVNGSLSVVLRARDLRAGLVLDHEFKLLVLERAPGECLVGMERDRTLSVVVVLEGRLALVDRIARGHGAVAVVGDLDRGLYHVGVVGVAGLSKVLLGDGVGEGLFVLALGVLGGVGHVRLRVGDVEPNRTIGGVKGLLQLRVPRLELERERILCEVAARELLVDLKLGRTQCRVVVHELNGRVFHVGRGGERAVTVVDDRHRNGLRSRCMFIAVAAGTLFGDGVGEGLLQLAVLVDSRASHVVLRVRNLIEGHVAVRVVLLGLVDVVALERELELTVLELATVEDLVSLELDVALGCIPIDEGIGVLVRDGLSVVLIRVALGRGKPARSIVSNDNGNLGNVLVVGIALLVALLLADGVFEVL